MECSPLACPTLASSTSMGDTQPRTFKLSPSALLSLPVRIPSLSRL